MKYKSRWSGLTVLACAAVFIGSTAALSGCSGQASSFGTGSQSGGDPAQVEFFAMDTYMTLTAYGDGAEAALEKAQAQVEKLESEWSVTDENSEIYQLDHSGGNPVTLSEDTADIVSFALEMARETDGDLDPTIYPVLEAWGFTTDENRIPSQEELDALLANVGYERVQMDGTTVQLPAGMEFDLGAVGKGYAGDILARLLKDEGVTSALLDLGGNIQAVGERPGGGDWRLGIRSPFDGGEGVLGMLLASDCAVVTSGNYERYFVGEDGKEYGHIIDPDTGYPVDNGLASVTIITEEGKRGDALSTSMFVKGLDEASRYWRDHQDFEMLLVTQDGQIYLTEGIEDQFTLSSDFGNMETHVIKRDEQ